MCCRSVCVFVFSLSQLATSQTLLSLLLMTLLASMLASALRGARRPAKGWAVLTPKLGPVGFYKGRGVPATGRHTRKGVCVGERVVVGRGVRT
jgi:hypothetical protein